jgi:hypothetical protein
VTDWRSAKEKKPAHLDEPGGNQHAYHDQHVLPQR